MQQSLLFPVWNKQCKKPNLSAEVNTEESSLWTPISMLFDRTASHLPQSWRDFSYICGSRKCISSNHHLLTFHSGWLPSVQDNTQKCPLVKWVKWLKNLRHSVCGKKLEDGCSWTSFQLKGLRGSWCKGICCCENTDSNKILHIWNNSNWQESAEKEENLCWSNINWWLITTMKLMPPHIQTDCN